MMFFVYHLQTYSPKNRAWKKVVDYVFHMKKAGQNGGKWLQNSAL